MNLHITKSKCRVLYICKSYTKAMAVLLSAIVHQIRTLRTTFTTDMVLQEMIIFLHGQKRSEK